MRKELVHSVTIGGEYSTTTTHATKAGGFVFVTGQVANTPGSDPLTRPERIGELGSIEEQTIQVLENIKAILEEAGTSFDHVVKRNIYMTHVGDRAVIHKIMERYFSSKVASTGIVAGLVPVSARVEIDVIAVVPEPS